MAKNVKQQGKKKLRITDTTLRDAHQSLWATRMRTDDILGILDEIDSVGYYSLEIWGGATFDVCLRFLRENPWERLRLTKAHAKKTPLQMLLRGQNLVGYRNYSDDVVDRFVALACENGMDIFRVFDALNDTRNIESAVRAVKKYGGHAQGTICYTISPVHTVDKFVQYAKEQIDIGIDSLCIKDMAGILSPVMAEGLVAALAGGLDLPVQLHCHASSGMAVATYMAGVRAGAEAIDCAVSSMAGFSSQPPVETMISIFADTEFETHLDLAALEKIEKYFADIAPKRRQTHTIQPIIDPDILIHQIPGGMISNFRSQLEKQKALAKLPEVLDEVAAVRKDLGYPPLVTPTSQIVGTQAVMNVLARGRYKMVPNEVKNYVKGMYGRSPAPLEAAFVKKIIGDEEVITCRPADLIEPMLPAVAKSLDPKLIDNEEDIISYSILPEPALEYFKWRRLPPDQRPEIPADIEMKQEQAKDKPAAAEAPKNPGPDRLTEIKDVKGLSELIANAAGLNVQELSIRKGDLNLTLKLGDMTVEERQYDEDEPILSGTSLKASKNEAQENEKPSVPEYAATINSPIGGTFYAGPGAGQTPFVKVGEEVGKGDKVCIVEAMKMLNEIYADKTCRIIKFLVENGQTVAKDQPLFAVEELQ
jgi:oxaloacetate decarboxylase (Na+ extruding) subunit alpha